MFVLPRLLYYKKFFFSVCVNFTNNLFPFIVVWNIIVSSRITQSENWTSSSLFVLENDFLMLIKSDKVLCFCTWLSQRERQGMATILKIILIRVRQRPFEGDDLYAERVRSFSVHPIQHSLHALLIHSQRITEDKLNSFYLGAFFEKGGKKKKQRPASDYVHCCCTTISSLCFIFLHVYASLEEDIERL